MLEPCMIDCLRAMVRILIIQLFTVSHKFERGITIYAYPYYQEFINELLVLYITLQPS